MAQPDDPFRFERGPEAVDPRRLEQGLERLRERADPLVEKLSEELRLTRDDVMRLAVVLFGQYLDLTRAKDTFVIVVRGTATPYDNALQVLVAGDEGGEDFAELIEQLQARVTTEQGDE